MPAPALLEGVRETVGRKVVMAVELLDPVTGIAVSEGIAARVSGLPPPVVTPSRRYVWHESGPPRARHVEVGLVIANPQYDLPADPLDFDLPANDGTVAPAALLRQAMLRTTSLYRPPEGAIAVAGTLQRGDGSRDAVAGGEVTIEISHSGGLDRITSGHVARTSVDGDFTAVLTGLSDEIPDAEPGAPGAIAGWLIVRVGADTKTMAIDPPLRPGRTTTLSAPLKWEPDPP